MIFPKGPGSTVKAATTSTAPSLTPVTARPASLAKGAWRVPEFLVSEGSPARTSPSPPLGSLREETLIYYMET